MEEHHGAEVAVRRAVACHEAPREVAAAPVDSAGVAELAAFGDGEDLGLGPTLARLVGVVAVSVDVDVGSRCLVLILHYDNIGGVDGVLRALHISQKYSCSLQNDWSMTFVGYLGRNGI